MQCTYQNLFSHRETHQVSLDHLMGAMRLKIDQKIEDVFISKGIKFFSYNFIHKRELGIQ